ncbi:MAG TPA: MarC family protein [Thermoplasmataceae archaeon]|nr:MarC family protein [Thermoplasmataceae archaeon]
MLTVVAAIFALVNPLGAVPTLVALTEGFSREELNRVIRKAIMVAGGMILGFMFLGEYIFSVLGIDISDFKIAGGILLFKVAFDMIQGKLSTTKLTPLEQQDYVEREAVGIVPIGVPLLAGPGSITTAIIYFNSRSNGILDRFSVIIAIIVVMIIAFFILKFSMNILNRIGKTGSLIISRIMGLLLAAIGIEFIVSGIAGVLVTLGI